MESMGDSQFEESSYRINSPYIFRFLPKIDFPTLKNISSYFVLSIFPPALAFHTNVLPSRLNH